MKTDRTTKHAKENRQETELFVSILNKKHEEEIAKKDEEIKQLKQRIEALKIGQKQLLSKKSSISTALVEAVDKAKSIEDNSKKVYEQKINQLNALQVKWEKLLDEMLEKHPDMTETKNIANMTQTFKNIMVDVLSDEFSLQKGAEPKTSGDHIRTLLSRVNNKPKQESVKIERIEKTPRMKVSAEEEKTVSRPTRIKPIIDITINKNEKYETLADKFLEDFDEEEQSVGLNKAVYSKTSATDPYAFPDVNESGFDLEEAVNPKEGLEQIMKSFDFFEE